MDPSVFFSNTRKALSDAIEGYPIAIQAVLDRYAGYIRYFSKMNDYYNSDMEDYIRTKLIESLFKFRLDLKQADRPSHIDKQGNTG